MTRLVILAAWIVALIWLFTAGADAPAWALTAVGVLLGALGGLAPPAHPPRGPRGRP
jgi:hypothetical protein